MAQSQWGKVDRKQDSPIWAPAQVNKPSTRLEANALFNNTTSGAYITGATVGTYGVSTAEMADAVVGQVASVTVSTAGSGFTVRPTVSFSGGGQGASGATATATAKVVSVTLGGGTGAGGQDYAAGDVVTVAGGTAGTVAKINVLTVNASGGALTLSINVAGSYTALPTLANNTPTGGNGTSLRVNLSYGVNGVTVTANGSGYTAVPTVTFGGAGGTGATGAATLRSEQGGITHAGWVLRKKVGNRTQYETLVAGKFISSDASDDTVLPE
jgi:hypothetical protein